MLPDQQERESPDPLEIQAPRAGRSVLLVLRVQQVLQVVQSEARGQRDLREIQEQQVPDPRAPQEPLEPPEPRVLRAGQSVLLGPPDHQEGRSEAQGAPVVLVQLDRRELLEQLELE